MTQTSRPQQGRQTDYPDAGGYTANQWARIFRLWSGDYDTQGPFERYLNALEVTNPSGKTIRVASGAALVNGHVFFNEDLTDPEGTASNVDFEPSTPTSGSRIDRVVLVQNNTDSSYDGTPDYGSAVLEFPSDLTDYESSASVPAHSTRLAILTGVEGGAARSLTQDAALDGDIWMIELAQYTIATDGTVSNLTDEREFVDAIPRVTRRIFVPVMQGYNFTDSTAISTKWLTPTSIGFGYRGSGWNVIELPDGKVSMAAAQMNVPSDLDTNYTMTVTALVLVESVSVAGDVRCQVVWASDRASWGEYGNGGGAVTTYSVPTDSYYNLFEMAYAELTPVSLDILYHDNVLLGLEFHRDGNHGDDTLSQSVYLLGFFVDYVSKYSNEY